MQWKSGRLEREVRGFLTTSSHPHSKIIHLLERKTGEGLGVGAGEGGSWSLERPPRAPPALTLPL